jgi:hypothetical protein
MPRSLPELLPQAEGVVANPIGMGGQPRHNLHYAKYVLFHAYITFQETYLDKIIEIARIVNTNDRLIKIDVFSIGW